MLELIFNTAIIVILVVYWIFAFVMVYHLTRFGIGTQPKRFAGIFLSGSLVLSGVIILIFTRIDVTKILQ